jgi:hypothetical protein
MTCRTRSLHSLAHWAGITALLTSLFSVSAGAATFTVTNLGDRGPGSLRQAIIDANAQAGADKINFASGVIGNIPFVNTITISGDLELVGLGADQITISGIGATLFKVDATVTVTISKLKLTDGWNGIENQGKLTINNCTISGNDSSGINNTDNAILIINNSTISGNTSSSNGGGINNASGSLTINNSTISGNISYGNSGGIYNASGSVTIVDSTISSNSGGIYNDSGNVTINNGTISDNSVGGIYNASGSMIINNSTISNTSGGSGIYNASDNMIINNTKISNTSPGGSGIYNADSGKITVDNSTIFGNSGGGISNTSSLTVNNSTISGNTSSDGGGIYNTSGSLTINNSTISGNTSYSYGGGIYNTSGSLTINNSTISGNTSSYAGGIYNTSGSLTINNSTISGNTSSSSSYYSYSYGGGIYSDGKLSIGNSLIAGNSAANGSEIYMTLASNFSSLGYNLFGQNRNSGLYGATPAATDIILVGDITTAIAPLADNGGPTQTHLLTALSQALDAGSNSLIPAEITTDQRGAPRIEYGVVDIGAVEGTEAFVATTASTFDILINKVGNGIITSNPIGMTCNSTTCTGTFDAGTLVKLTAKPATGYTFSGWSGGGCSGTGICSVNMTAAQTIKATFTAAPVTLYSLSINKSGNGSVTSNPTGINCGSTCSAKFAKGKVVTLNAKPDADATFVSWSGCAPIAANPLQCRIIVSSNKIVTATFSAKNTAAADISVTGVLITPASPSANSTFTAAITVKNSGSIKSDGGSLDVWANQATVQACKAESDTWEEIGQLAAGESKTITVNLKVRSAGAKQLRAFVDSQCTVTESKETNNQLVKSYTVK